MTMEVVRQKSFTLDDVLADVRLWGLWPTTYAVDRATEAALHWHTEDVYGYILRAVPMRSMARATESTSRRAI